MPSYRYYTTDLLTGNLIGDIDPYGVYMNKILNSAGQFTGTVKLIDNPVVDALSIQATEPGRNAIYVERDGTLIWGGIIWTRTYNNQSQALQLSAQTFESYFSHVVFENHFIQQKVAQEQIFVNMVNQLQAQSVNLGFVFASVPVSGVDRTVLIPGYEYHFATDAITQLVNVDLGLEYSIDVIPSGVTDRPTKQIRLGYPQLGQLNHQIAFDYPGTIHTYWMPESAAKSGAKFAALGYGTGNKIARSVATDYNTIAQGYPAWWVVNQYSTIADLRTIQDKAAGDAARFKMPLRSPTFELKPETAVQFSAWNNLGDTFYAYIQDVRYPAGFVINSRMIGWELTPESSSGSESLQITIEGADV